MAQCEQVELFLAIDLILGALYQVLFFFLFNVFGSRNVYL